MQKDYGLHLLEKGLGDVGSISFMNVPLDHLAVVGPYTISTVLNKVEDGVTYAMSFDFHADSQDSLFNALPEEVVDALVEQMGDDFQQPIVIEFSEPLPLNLQARLGDLQQSTTEAFVPLLVQGVTA